MNVCVCQHIEFLCIGIWYTFEGIPDLTFVGSFDPAQEFLIRLGVSAYVIGHGIGGKVIPAKMAQLTDSQLLE